MFGVARGASLYYAAAMTTPTPMAGGFFLIVPIVAGFVWGLGSGRALVGAVVGLGIGLVLALLIWAIDRRRQRH